MARAVTFAGVAPAACAGLPGPRQPSEQPASAPTVASRVPSHGGVADPALPCLLRTARSCKTSALTFRVKNTFIDVLATGDEEEERGRPAIRKAKTAPSAVMRRTWSGCPAAPSGDINQGGDDDDGNPQITATAPPRPVVQIEPLERRRPEESIGSLGHTSGTCKPCAWYWRLQGCTNGAGCGHCHLCPVGEARRRRNENKKAGRSRGQTSGAEARTSDSGAATSA